MRNGTVYARKLKKAFAQLGKTAPEPVMPEPTDPIEQLIFAVLSQDTSADRARKAMKRLQDAMVDYNDLRASGTAEISETISRYVPKSVQCGKVLVRLLNEIYQREYAVSLESLRDRGVREVKQYLESIDGATPYVTASVLLWSLGGHAIPINNVTYQWLIDQELVHPAANHAEVQSFLERHVSAADAKSFCLELEAAARAGTKVPSNGRAKSAAASRKKSGTASRTTAKRGRTTPSSTRSAGGKTAGKKTTGYRKRRRTKR